MSLPHKVAQDAHADAYDEITRFLSTLDEADLARPSRCAGWLVGDVVFHLMLDAQELLVSMGTPADHEGRLDHVAYWRNYATIRSDADDLMTARHVRLGAAAYPGPQALVDHWTQTARAAIQLAGYATDSRVVRSYGFAMTITDMLAVSAVEATIHHLDMLGDLAGKPVPRPGPTELTVRTLDALLGNVDRPDWDDHLFILKTTGRLPLDVPEKRFLDSLGVRIPLIG